MPNYDYECTSCGHGFTLFQMMSEPPKKKCPECGKKVNRLIGGGSGLVFKGSGFYQTDYKKSGSSNGGAKGGACSTESKNGGCGKGGCNA